MTKKKKNKYTKGLLLSTYRKEDQWKVLLSDFAASVSEGMLIYLVMGYLFTENFTNNGVFLLKEYDYISYVVAYFLIFKTSRRLYEVGDKKERIKVVLTLSGISLIIVLAFTLILNVLQIPLDAGFYLNWVGLGLIMVAGFAVSALVKRLI